MSTLKIKKVSTLPATLSPSTLYFLKSQTSNLTLYLTDSAGAVAYRSYDNTDITSITQAIINSLINHPNGIAGLDANGNVIGSILAALDGQDGDIRHSNEYVWDDLMETIAYRNLTGGNNPTWGTLWNNHQGMLFSGTIMNQVFLTYHFKHDIALNKPVFPHVHFTPMDNNPGTVRFGWEYSIAKGHGQESYATTDSLVYIDFTFPANSFKRNFVAELASPGISSTSIEPDANMKVRLFRDGANDSYNSDIHVWQADIHYMKARLGTKNKSPNFFS